MFWTNALIDVLLFFYVIVCVLMGLVIMMQRSKQEGLGAAFGGSITSEVFGAGTSAFLVKTTVVLASLFFILSIALARLNSHRSAIEEKGPSLQEQLMQPVTAPSTNAAPSSSTIAPSGTPAAPSTVNTPAATAPTTAPAPATPATPAK